MIAFHKTSIAFTLYSCSFNESPSEPLISTLLILYPANSKLFKLHAAFCLLPVSSYFCTCGIKYSYDTSDFFLLARHYRCQCFLLLLNTVFDFLLSNKYFLLLLLLLNKIFLCTSIYELPY